MSEQPKDEPEKKARLPYERPAVLTEEVFETLALSCANAPRICAPGPGQS